MTMEVKVFGKPGCEYCKTTMKKFETFFGRWNIDDSKVKLSFFDMETTMDGLAEGAFYEVSKIPATVIEQNGSIVKRWDGVVPLSEDFKQYFAQFSGPVND
ncbi:MAG: thioredoxin family protein [Candidatus Margulisbacteria bacterium]|jgi:glutaredoxin|nr:thioredoxin family protein [Candidatus Margulisiibacteriota bacterium]